jgi:hypothetical protein
MRGIHLGTRPTGTSPGTPGTPGARVTFIVVDDVVYLTDPVTGYVYEAPVTFVGPTTLPSGLITAEADTLLFHYAGGTWSSPASQVEGNAPVGGIILNDTFYVTLASVTYAMPVTATEGIPGMPPGGETSLVVGSDGSEFMRVVFPDGEVRYLSVYDELP